MNKVTLIAFIAVCSLAFTQGNVLDDGIYTAIHAILKNQYPNEPEKTQCMVDDFRRNKVADKFYTFDLIVNTEKLQREIQPYVDEANLKCTLIAFFQSTWGILALILLFCLAISIICCLIRCICC